MPKIPKRATHLVLLCLSSLFIQEISSEITLVNGAYEGIVVALSPDLEETTGLKARNKLQYIFMDASRALHTATKGMATFGNIIFLFPNSWNVDNSVEDTIVFEDSHIRVDRSNPLYGEAPYTQQSKGCGQQGDFIHYSSKYFMDAHNTDLYGDQGRVLLHEWAHFRYGVFDEYGFPGDPIYPNVYWENSLTSTGCSDGTVSGSFNGQCEINSTTGQYDKDCRFIPDGTTNSTSSLMYTHFLTEVKHFCENATHNQYAPTKHNAICEGRSTWDVISKNPDFKDRLSYPFKDPIFKYVKSNPPRFFILADNSMSMKDKERFGLVRKSINSFFKHFLPSGAKMGLSAFNSKVEAGLTSTDQREIIQKFLEKKFDNYVPSDDQTTWDIFFKAINHGIEQLETEGGILILITAGFNGVLQDEKFEELVTRLQTARIRMVSILYPFTTSITNVHNQHFATLAQKTKGRNYFVYENNDDATAQDNVLDQLTSIMADVGQMGSAYPANTYEIIRKGYYHEQEISDTITNEGTLAKSFTAMFSVKPGSDVDLSQFQIYDPSGKKYDITPSMIGDHSIYFTSQNSSVMSGEWRYTMSRKNPNPSEGPWLSALVITSRLDPESQPIRVKGWTNVENIQVDALKTPVIIYAEVKKGTQPIVNARVVAKVQWLPSTSNKNNAEVEVQLLDNGNGDPDIIKEDGIYSRYFTKFGNEGIYQIRIFVDDNEGSANIIQQNGYSGILPLDSSLPYCCGSSTGLHQGVPTGQFTQSCIAGIFNLKSAPPAGEDHMPPVRVLDFRVKEVNQDKNTVVLVWTAPGDDYDSGKVKKYDIRNETDRKKLLDKYEVAGHYPNDLMPVEGGVLQEMEMQTFPSFENPRIYFALRAIDAAGNAGKVSNIVGVGFNMQRTTATASTGEDSLPTQAQKIQQAGTNDLGITEIVLIAAGVGAGLVILIVILLVLYKKQKSNKYNVDSSTQRKAPTINI